MHLINCIPFPLLNNRSPFQHIYNKPPTLLHLKCFGCLTFSSTSHAHRSKFDPRARKSVFLGYMHGTKGYLLYDLQSHDFYVSRNFVFYENVLPFNIPTTQKTNSPHPSHEPYETDVEPHPLSQPITPYIPPYAFLHPLLLLPLILPHLIILHHPHLHLFPYGNPPGLTDLLVT